MELTLQEAKKKLSVVDAELQFVDFDALSFDRSNGMVKFEGSGVEKELSEDVLKNYSALAGFPMKYVGSLTPDMFFGLMKYHADTLKDRGVFTRVSAAFDAKDGKMAGFVDRTFSKVGVADVLEAVASELGDTSQVRRLHHTMTSAAFTVTDESLNASLLTNSDLAYFGATVSLNRLGHSAPDVRATSHRVGCGNVMHSVGQVSAQRFKMYAAPREVVLEKFKSASRDSVKYIHEKMIPDIRRSIEHKVDINKGLNRLATLNRFPQEVQEGVLAAYGAEPGESLFHIASALTRAANNPAMGAWSDRLRFIAAHVTESDHVAECPKCHSLVI